MRFYCVIFSFLCVANFASAESVGYKESGVDAEGYLAKPKKSAVAIARPAVLIVHDWMGPSDFTKKKADEIAELGYYAFAADIYGKGVRPKNAKEAGELAGKYKSGNRAELRSRIQAAYDVLKATPGVDAKKIVVIGYCFGGTTALELARSGADLAGVVSFHGGLSNPDPKSAKNIRGKTLVLHGAIDPFVGTDEVNAFQKEMNEADNDYQFVSYSGAVHAFAIPKAGNDIKSGAAYNATADPRSWEEFKRFMKETTDSSGSQTL